MKLIRGENVTEGEMEEASVRGICDALVRRDVVKALSFFADDATLTWGPFEFEGRERIKTWIAELEEMFPELIFREKSLKAQRDGATQEFVIEAFIPDGRKALLPGTAIYEFRDGKIKLLRIAISHGYLIRV